MRQLNWHRVFGAEDKLISRVDSRENPSASDVAQAAADIQSFYRKQISGNVTLGELLRSKNAAPNAQ